MGGTVQRISAGDPDLEPRKDRNLEHSCPEVSFRKSLLRAHDGTATVLTQPLLSPHLCIIPSRAKALGKSLQMAKATT